MTTTLDTAFQMAPGRRLLIDRQQIAVYEMGAGEPCLLIHGSPQTHWCWRGVATKLAATHRVIAPDWFGSGQSERSMTSHPSYERETARIGALLDALSISEANLVCHDYGGFLGLGFALRNPRRVLRLAIINSRAQGGFAPSSFLLFNALCAVARLPFGERLFSLLPHYTIHRRGLSRYVRNGSFSEAELEHYIGFLRSAPGRRWLGHFYRYFQATRRRELRSGAPSLAMPAAVVWGDRDPYSPVKIGIELSTLLPNATFTRLPGCDHFSPEERPDDVAAALLALLMRPIRP